MVVYFIFSLIIASLAGMMTMEQKHPLWWEVAGVFVGFLFAWPLILLYLVVILICFKDWL